MAVNFEYYRVFCQVARSRSFTGAARALMSSQPSVTRCIQSLEQQLGCTRFVRTRRGVSLTAGGELLYHTVGPACERLQQGEAELAGALSLQGGVVRLSSTETALHELLLDRMDSFRARWPGVRLHLTNGTTPQALAHLRSGRVEMAVVSGPVQTGKEVKLHPLVRVEEMLVAGPGMAHLARKPLHLRDLAGLPMICLEPGTCARDFYDELFAAKGLNLNPEVEVTTADLVLATVQHDLGVGFVPAGLARPLVESGAVTPLRLAFSMPPRWIYAARVQGRPLSAASRAFWKHLTDGSEG